MRLLSAARGDPEKVCWEGTIILTAGQVDIEAASSGGTGASARVDARAMPQMRTFTPRLGMYKYTEQATIQ
jgi:hypothetical protein